MGLHLVKMKMLVKAKRKYLLFVENYYFYIGETRHAITALALNNNSNNLIENNKLKR